MNKFEDFGIKPTEKKMTGDKIKIDRILNREVEVHDFDIKTSKFPDRGNGKCLCLQISLENSKRVVFTGSKGLQQLIEQVPKDKFPFTTKIVKTDNDSFLFT